MTRKFYISHLNILSIMLAMISACASSQGSSGINDWVTGFVNKGEILLCQRNVGGEYFFIARIGDKVKVGSRLDVTQANGTPQTFIIGWRFQNEKDNHLATNTLPTPVREGYIKTDGKMYAEHVQYQTLYLSQSQKLRVTVDVKKCPTEDCVRGLARKGDTQRRISLCEVRLSER